jgi:hypothetical protein
MFSLPLLFSIVRNFIFRSRGIVLRKFFDDSDSDDAEDNCSMKDNLRQELKVKNENTSRESCESVDFGPAFAAAGMQRSAAAKQAVSVPAAAASAVAITAQLLSCSSHSVAAPSVSPLQLQARSFVFKCLLQHETLCTNALRRVGL